MPSTLLFRKLGFIFSLPALFFASFACAEVIELDNAGLKQSIADGVPVVDIRRADEWKQTGIIKGSHLITLPTNKAGDAYDVAAWMEVFGKVIQPDQPVIIICRTGNRSKPVAGYLDQKAGYTKVYNATSGIASWIQEGNPTVPYKKKKQGKPQIDAKPAK